MSRAENKETPACNILIVDDNPENLKILGGMLREQGQEIRVAHDGASALRSAEVSAPDIILLDIHMPGMDGYEVCRRLKENPDLRDIPVIFVSALGETFNKVQAYECGGADYITKPFQVGEVMARVGYHLKSRRLLAESEEHYRTFLRDLPVGAYRCTLGEDSSYLFVNPALAGMMGCESEDALLKIGPGAAFADQDQRRRFTDELAAHGNVEGFTLDLVTVDGKPFVAQVWAHVRESVDGKCLEGVVVDVTEHVALEARFQQAQKMEAIGTLAGGVAHDFNNILSAILGYTDLAASTLPEGSETVDYLSEVRKASRRATDLVAQILAFSRQAEKERKPIRLQQVVKEALKLLRASIPSTIEITTEIDSACGPVVADPTDIHQILMNLCSNAYHAMRDRGGVLMVKMSPVDVDQEDVSRDPELGQGAYVRLQVQDTGHGMDRETQRRIFEPYFTTKERGEGTGLGLATVHGIVKDLGGSIHVYSEPDEGTAFTVLLPQVVTSGKPTEPYEDQGELSGTERILFIDDEEPITQFVQKALVQLGYDVTVQTSGEQAVELFRTMPDRFDAVVTDQMMPRMKGTELANHLLSIRRDIPIILCSGFGDAMRDATPDDRIRDYVMKPIIARDLAKSIRKVLDDGRAQ